MRYAENTYPKEKASLFLESALAQVTPGIIRRIYESEGPGGPYVVTPGDKLNMMMDYQDAIQHDAGTLRNILRPILAP